jgi:hypothetical protein
MPSSSEMVFVLTRPRGRFANVVSSLGELWAGELPPMQHVDAVFDATRNRVLVSAHYDARALTDGVRTRIQIIARDAGVVVLDGSALDDLDRRALVAEGEHRVDHQPAFAVALWNLARMMGGEEVWSGEPATPAPSEPRTPAKEITRPPAHASRSRPGGGIVVPPEQSSSSPSASRPGRLTPRGMGAEPAPLPGPTHTEGLPPRTRTPTGPLGSGPMGRTPTPRNLSTPGAARTIMGAGTASSSSGPNPSPPTLPKGPTGPTPPRSGASRTANAMAARTVSGLGPPGPKASSGLRPPEAPSRTTRRDVIAPGALNAAPGARTTTDPNTTRAAEQASAAASSSASANDRSGVRARPQPTPSIIDDEPNRRLGRSAEDGTAPKVDLEAARTRTAKATPSLVHNADPDDLLDAPTHRRPERRTARLEDDVPGLAESFGTAGTGTGTAPTGTLAGASSPFEGPSVVGLGTTPPPSSGRPMSSFDLTLDSGPITVADPIARTGSDPFLPALGPHTGDPAEQSQIDVRYLRSGRWAPARLRALSLKGAYLITAAFPRVGDHVHIALGLGDLGALVRGAVFHVTTAADIASTGTSGFAVRFELDDAARAQLATLLHRARAAGVTITPPPPRGSVRLPVQWPVKLATNRGATKGDALDVSRGGMFVQAVRALDVDQPVSFSAVLDDGNAPVSGRARVVREINESDAARRGLRAGFGLAIQEMGDADLDRWNLFLARVQRRGEHRILVGAAPARLAEVSAGLTGAGYAVVGGTDAGSLVQLSDAQARPPDVAVIDATLLEGSEPNWLETLFSARKVPCVTLRGDARRARVVVDKLLAV